MKHIRDEFEYRVSLLQKLSVDESKSRLTGFYDWMLSQSEIKPIVERLIENDSDALTPEVSTPEQVAAFGVKLLREIQSGTDPFQLAFTYNIKPGFNTRKIQDHLNVVLERFIIPAINHIFRELPEKEQAGFTAVPHNTQYPLEITESLRKFKTDHPDPRRTAFIMMQFGSTKLHEKLVSAIRDTLEAYGITALRADDKEYHDDLFPNVLTYLHGCGFGIAVFERLVADDFNPNVSLEVGYMRAIRTPVCLLKDRTLTTLPTDLVGKLYKSFDPQDPETSIPPELKKWLVDKEIIT